MLSRIKKIQTILAEQSLDALLISSYHNVRYLTGYDGFVPDERDGYVFITKTHAYILTNVLYAEAMYKNVPHLKLIELNRDNPLNKSIGTLCNKLKLYTIGFEANNLTVSEYNSISALKLKCIASDMRSLRRSKNEFELAKIQQACILTENAYKYILTIIKPGISEIAIEHLIRKYYYEHNATESFRSIVAFGSNSSVPHHLATHRKLKKRDFVLLDIGANVNGYSADLSRSFFVGKPTAKQKDIYETVLAAQNAVSELIKSKLNKKEVIKAQDLDAQARKFIADKNYPPFPYSLGHGIGLDYHEAPLLNPASNDDIIENDVFTLEPGIHITGEIGVRIEDDFVIHDNQLISLTTSSRELIVL